MIAVTKHGIILEKTENSFENEGVFNPGIYQEGNTVHMYYRAVREGNFSCIGYCKLDGPLKVSERFGEPIFYPNESHEFQGTEDPRITKIDDTYYLSYATYDGINVYGAYATSKDLFNFERKGVITPKFTFQEYSKIIKRNCEKISDMHFMFYNLFERYQIAKLLKSEIYVWDKNVVFFPKKIKQKFTVIHRLHKSIQILYFNDPSELTKDFWKEYSSDLQKHILLFPKGKHENGHIGAGCPPIETPHGWLLIYHSAQYTAKGYIYHTCAALFDLEYPMKLIGRLNEPLFSPTETWEKKGYLNNVVFPTGTAIFNDRLYIYYDAADSRVAVASVNMNELLHKLKN